MHSFSLSQSLLPLPMTCFLQQGHTSQTLPATGNLRLQGTFMILSTTGASVRLFFRPLPTCPGSPGTPGATESSEHASTRFVVANEAAPHFSKLFLHSEPSPPCCRSPHEVTVPSHTHCLRRGSHAPGFRDTDTGQSIITVTQRTADLL